MLLRLSIQRVARGIGRALGQLQLEITFDGVQSEFCVWTFLRHTLTFGNYL